MGTDVVLKAFGGVEAAKKYAQAAYAAVAGVQIGNDGKPILKLDKDTGEWFFGQEDTPLHKTDLLALNPASFKHGFIAFDGNAVAEDEDGEMAEILLPITQPLPYREDLPRLAEPRKKRNARSGDRGPRWMDQLAVELVVIDGKNKGAEMVYKPTSVGGLRLCAKLIGEVARRLDAGETDIVPLIELWSSSYNHQTYGEVHNPEHAIVEWKDFDDGDFVPATPARTKSGAEKADPKEKTRRGDDVDARASRSARRRDDDDAEDRAPRANGRRAPREDEVVDLDEDGNERRTRRAPVDDAKPARRGRSVDDVADTADEEPAPRRSRREEPMEGRSRRGRDEEPADAKPATRARRARDDDEAEEADERPARSRRRDEDEDDRAAAPRGRRAAAGGRARR